MTKHRYSTQRSYKYRIPNHPIQDLGGGAEKSTTFKKMGHSDRDIDSSYRGGANLVRDSTMQHMMGSPVVSGL